MHANNKMATVSAIKRKGGFVCEFVEELPEVIQSKCPICELILREPYQAPCCGKSFCKVCIKKKKDKSKPCPTCKEASFEIFYNKGLEITLSKFQVYCSQKEEGCEWKGELGQLEKHKKKCNYGEIRCTYCFELLTCFNAVAHQTEHCPKRPFSCEYCHNYKSNYEEVVNDHWPVCGYHPVRCPNECGTFPQRQALGDHINKDCPKTLAACDFHHVGCDVKLPRKEMPAHLKENLVAHMSLQAAGYSKLLASHDDLQSQVNKLEVENKLLKNELEGSIQMIDELKLEKADKKTVTQLVQHIGLPAPLDLVMPNYEQHKRERDSWYSSPFFTHPRGYKMQLRVDTDNGYSKGSVYVCLMKGEFDNHLKWPFRGTIVVQLVDQETGKGHETLKIQFTDQTPNDFANRVTKGERNIWGWGRRDYLEHIANWSRYCSNDCLCFRVEKIEC